MLVVHNLSGHQWTCKYLRFLGFNSYSFIFTNEHVNAFNCEVLIDKKSIFKLLFCYSFITANYWKSFFNDQREELLPTQMLQYTLKSHKSAHGNVFLFDELQVLQLSMKTLLLTPHVVFIKHYSDIIMSAIASQITSITIVYSTIYSGVDQRKYHSSASLAFVREIHRWPMNSPHKGPVTRKKFPFDDVIMRTLV